MERPNSRFCNGKYSVLNNFCYWEFLTNNTTEYKSCKTCEYQRDEFNDNLIEQNYEDCSYPLKSKLMISGETMQCRKVSQILRYHVPNQL